MKKTIFTLSLLFSALLTNSLVLAHENEDLAELKAAHKGFLATMETLKGEKTAKFTGSQYLWVNNDGIWPFYFKNKNEVNGHWVNILKWRNGKFSVASVGPSYLIHGNTAMVTGHYYFRTDIIIQGERTKAGGYNRFVETWVKKNGEWRMITQSAVFLPGPSGGSPY